MLLSTLFSLIRIIEWIILIDVILSIVSTMGYGINLYHQVEKNCSSYNGTIQKTAEQLWFKYTYRFITNIGTGGIGFN